MDKTQAHDGPVLTARTLAGSGLRLTYRWQHDRYGHIVEWFDGSWNIPLLETIEGDGDQFWPPSPPLQQASLQQVSSGQTAVLLIGMAGKSHWSAAVEVDGDDSGSLVFDLACRINGKSGWLGSSYRPLCRLGSVTAESVQIIVDDATAVWLSSDLLIGENKAAEIRLEDDRLCIVPSAPVAEGLSTIRWKYRLSLHPPAEKHRG